MTHGNPRAGSFVASGAGSAHRADEMKPINVNETDFEGEVLRPEVPVLVDFFAPWCGPCNALAPVLDELAREYDGRVKFVKVNTDENKALALRYKINSIPTLVWFEGDRARTIALGLEPKPDLKKKLDARLDTPVD